MSNIKLAEKALSFSQLFDIVKYETMEFTDWRGKYGTEQIFQSLKDESYNDEYTNVEANDIRKKFLKSTNQVQTNMK